MAQHTVKKRGIVKGVRESWDGDGNADVEMEEPPTTKQMAEHRARMKGGNAGGAMVGDGKPHGRSHSTSMPMHTAAQFSIGDPVEMETTLRHYGPQRGKPETKAQERAEGES